MEHVTAQGVQVPALGLGTWAMRGQECRRAVSTALDLGYRHVDTAQMYDNESAVGGALAGSDVPRADVFLVTKVRRGNLAPDDLRTSVAASLDRLGTYVDLLLIHAPSPSVPIADSIAAMNDLQAAGDVRHIGVSNFSVAQLETAIDASRTPILTNQVEYHPYTGQADLLAFCVEHDVLLTAYSPLAEGRVVGNETLAAIGARYDRTAAQVALRWLVQQPQVAAIPKAASRAHQVENRDVFDFELRPEEMRQVFDLGGGLGSRLRAVLGF